MNKLIESYFLAHYAPGRNLKVSRLTTAERNNPAVPRLAMFKSVETHATCYYVVMVGTGSETCKFTATNSHMVVVIITDSVAVDTPVSTGARLPGDGKYILSPMQDLIKYYIGEQIAAGTTRIIAPRIPASERVFLDLQIRKLPRNIRDRFYSSTIAAYLTPGYNGCINNNEEFIAFCYSDFGITLTPPWVPSKSGLYMVETAEIITNYTMPNRCIAYNSVARTPISEPIFNWDRMETLVNIWKKVLVIVPVPMVKNTYLHLRKTNTATYMYSPELHNFVVGQITHLSCAQNNIIVVASDHSLLAHCIPRLIIQYGVHNYNQIRAQYPKPTDAFVYISISNKIGVDAAPAPTRPDNAHTNRCADSQADVHGEKSPDTPTTPLMPHSNADGFVASTDSITLGGSTHSLGGSTNALPTLPTTLPAPTPTPVPVHLLKGIRGDTSYKTTPHVAPRPIRLLPLVSIDITPKYRAPTNVASLVNHPHHNPLTESDIIKISAVSGGSAYVKLVVDPLIRRMMYRFRHGLLTLAEYVMLNKYKQAGDYLEYANYRSATINLHRDTFWRYTAEGHQITKDTYVMGYPLGIWADLQRELFKAGYVKSNEWIASMQYAAVISGGDVAPAASKNWPLCNRDTRTDINFRRDIDNLVADCDDLMYEAAAALAAVEPLAKLPNPKVIPPPAKARYRPSKKQKSQHKKDQDNNADAQVINDTQDSDDYEDPYDETYDSTKNVTPVQRPRKIYRAKRKTGIVAPKAEVGTETPKVKT